MNETEFLRLSDRECVKDLPSKDEFIHEFVFGYQKINLSHKVYWKKGNKSFARYEMPYYQSWQGLGKGIEHANENEFVINFLQYADTKDWHCHLMKGELGNLGCFDDGSIFLVFWIAYMKALGVFDG